VAAPSLADVALGAGSRIGRYFGLVSAIPSALFVLFVSGLVASGAWSGTPDVDRVATAVRDLSLAEVSVLVVLSLAFALALHPMQFALVQLLEGYWGTTPFARRLAVARTRHHRRRWAEIDDAWGEASLELSSVDRNVLFSEAGDRHVPAIVAQQAFERARLAYPKRGERVMPTRLGNVLRRHEDDAGKQYGLEAITIAPHLMVVADPRYAAHLRDAREQLDLAVRLCALSLLAAVTAFAFLVTDGWWLLVTLVPYGLGHLFYRGTLVAAADYGTVLATVIDLERFRLYGRLHVPAPDDTHAERRANQVLMELLRSRTTVSLRYDHPSDSSVEVVQRARPERAPERPPPEADQGTPSSSR
jgi:hypothetical protein